MRLVKGVWTDETMRICSKCEEPKDISKYYRRYDRPNGDQFHKKCNVCMGSYKKKHQQDLEGRKEYERDYRITNRDEICRKSKDGTWDIQPRTTEKYRKRARELYQIKSKKVQERRKFKRMENPSLAISYKLSGRIKSAVKKNCTKKAFKTAEVIGCSVPYLMQHLQQTAIDNGYLDFDINYFSGKEYHIDHILPCDSFDLTDPEQQKKCFNWRNLQILSATENLKKGSKIPEEVVNA